MIWFVIEESSRGQAGKRVGAELQPDDLEEGAPFSKDMEVP